MQNGASVVVPQVVKRLKVLLQQLPHLRVSLPVPHTLEHPSQHNYNCYHDLPNLMTIHNHSFCHTDLLFLYACSLLQLTALLAPLAVTFCPLFITKTCLRIRICFSSTLNFFLIVLPFLLKKIHSEHSQQ